MKFKELSDWMVIDGYCATRIKVGGDINKISDRVAFIEKTPRVRVDKYKYAVESKDGNYAYGQDTDGWIYGYKDSDLGASEKSREWCDKILNLLGWE